MTKNILAQCYLILKNVLTWHFICDFVFSYPNGWRVLQLEGLRKSTDVSLSCCTQYCLKYFTSSFDKTFFTKYGIFLSIRYKIHSADTKAYARYFMVNFLHLHKCLWNSNNTNNLCSIPFIKCVSKCLSCSVKQKVFC